MQKLERMYMESRLWTCLTSGFLDDVKSRYHYEEKHLKLLKCVASDMISCLRWQESIYIRWREAEQVAEVIMTLGHAVDMLQKRYQESGRLLESYMVESISGELLMRGYGQLEEWLEDKLGRRVAAYRFLGCGEDYPLAMLPAVLKAAAQDKVVCNEAFCLTPQKSVVFFAELSRQAERSCGSICGMCSNKTGCSVRTCAKEEGSIQDVSGGVVHL